MPYDNKVSIWQARVQTENAAYQLWEDLFQCKTLEDYWESKQWRQVGIGQTAYRPYTLNLIYATIKIKLANIIYQNPQFLLTPKPSHSDWNAEMAGRAAEIKEGALNTIVQNKRVHFVKNLRLSALDSFFRFGIIETGYAADWQNPNKTRISVSSDDNPEIELTDAKVLSDEEVPENERIFFSHRKARRFRVSSDDSPILEHCNWCGYYSYIRKSVLAKTKGIDLPKELKNEYFGSDFSANAEWAVKNMSGGNLDLNFLNEGAFCKVWRIWDNVKKKKILVLETTNWPIVWEDDFERLPFPNVIWDERAPSKENIGFYPMPPVFQWISSQDEINQAREQLRNYRKRFTRKFWANSRVDPDELGKLSNNVDGEVIIIKGAITGEQALGQISNPEIGITIKDSISVSTADLNLVSATSTNAREIADRTTATESKIIDARAQIRESVEQMDFKQFVIDCGREALLTMQERFSEGMWIKISIDPSENFMDEVQDAMPVYRYITNQEINDSTYDWDIDLEVVNGTPAQAAEEEAKFLKFITIVTQMPQIALSPILLRELAIKVGYKNERVIREMQKAATVQLINQMRSAQASQSGNGGSGVSQSMSGNATPNPTSEIEQQLSQQLG